MKNKDSVVLIIPYFGTKPRWFQFFIETCRLNTDINFLFFSDCLKCSNSKNIKFITFNLDEFNILASRKLRLNINLENSYKICDLKPAFGKIFEDYIKTYTFWGYADIDVVFGTISNFITPDILRNYDIITAKREYLTGHFSLFKNCSYINNLFSSTKNYKEIFQSPIYSGFDECSFLFWDLLAGVSIFRLKHTQESMSHKVKKLDSMGFIRAYFENLVVEQDQIDTLGNLLPFEYTIVWEQGRLTNLNTNSECMYFHFHFMKKDPLFIVPDIENALQKFYVSSSGFYFEQNLSEQI